jgi:TolB-like protein/tetratricopeptide (TPR) repeat protein
MAACRAFKVTGTDRACKGHKDGRTAGGPLWPTSMTAKPDDRLDSWKEIAAYLRRGVRTVRRWERDEGLPVHRHVHNVLGSVYAYRSEIGRWRDRRGVARPSAMHRRASLAKSIAVLPFANLSADRENEYFADGLTDEVTSGLSRITALRVTSRTSAMTFKTTNQDVGAIARALGARYLLEGSVRRSTDRLRITARLIDAPADRLLWTDTWDGSLDDVFAMQERLSRVIVGALEVRLTGEEDRRLASRPIDTVHAYECYVRARPEAWRWRRDSIDHAIQLLRNGIALVGDNARLYGALGHAWLQYREAGIDATDTPVAEAEACASKLFALEPASDLAYQLRGWIHYCRGRIQDAVRDLNRALQADPGNADTLLLLINCYLISGQVAAARPLIERTLMLDPLTPITRCMPAFADLMEGKRASAIEPYRQMSTMDPGNPMARLFYIWALVLNERIAEAREVLDAFPLEVGATIPAQIAGFLVRAATRQGRPAAAPPDIDLRATAGDVFPRMLAQAYALAAMPDEAMACLRVAVDRGFINYPFLANHDPFLERIRTLPVFQELLAVVHDRWQAFEPA